MSLGSEREVDLRIDIWHLSRGRWLDIFRAFAPALDDACLRVGRHVPCPVHGGKDGFRLFEDAAETGGGICNTCNGGIAMPTGWKVLEWINGWDKDTAMMKVADFLNVSVYNSVRPKPQNQANPYWQPKRSGNNEIWNEASASSRLLTSYLNNRGLSQPCSALRLHPSLDYYENGNRTGEFPTMLAKVQDLDGNDVCLLRTYLDPNGQGKADVKSPKKLTSPEGLGTVTGAAIRLTEATDTVALAEGIETALAVDESTGVPVWATVSARGMESVQLPLEIRTVEIWADNDLSGVGQKAAEKAAERFLKEGREVYILTPPMEDSDWLDMLNRSTTEYLQATRKLATPLEQSVEEVVLPSVEPLPVHILPPVLQNFVKEGARAIGCPPDLIAVPLMVFAGTAIGASRVVQIKEGWTESPRVYAALVARAGEKKSPAFKLAMRPFIAHQNKLQAEFKEQERLWGKQKTQYELELQEWKRSARRGDMDAFDMPDPPSPPVLSQIFTTDATIEALSVLLEQNPRGLVLSRDELAGWTKSFNQYRSGRGADKEYWLSFWNGSDVVINRKGSEQPLILSNPFVSVVGCLPPSVLSEITRGGEDGLLDRVLFSYPNPVPLRWTEDEMSELTVLEVEKVFDGLFGLDLGASGSAKVVRFTAKARELWVDWVSRHYEEQNAPSFPEILRGPWAKLEAYCARFALIFQMIQYVSGCAVASEIDESSLLAAIALVNYFKSHTERVYMYLRTDSEDRLIADVLSFIDENGGETTSRELQRKKFREIKTASEAKDFLSLLAERGYGVTEQPTVRSVLFKRFPR